MEDASSLRDTRLTVPRPPKAVPTEPTLMWAGTPGGGAGPRGAGGGGMGAGAVCVNWAGATVLDATA